MATPIQLPADGPELDAFVEKLAERMAPLVADLIVRKAVPPVPPVPPAEPAAGALLAAAARLDAKAERLSDVPRELLAPRVAAKAFGIRHETFLSLIEKKRVQTVRTPSGRTRVSREEMARLSREGFGEERSPPRRTRRTARTMAGGTAGQVAAAILALKIPTA